MIERGQLVLLHFPQTNQDEGKLRPVLILTRLPGDFDDWLACMVTTQLRHAVPDFDEWVQPGDADFQSSGLKAASTIRIARLVVLQSDQLLGTLGTISEERQLRIRSRLAAWINPTASSDVLHP